MAKLVRAPQVRQRRISTEAPNLKPLQERGTPSSHTD